MATQVSEIVKQKIILFGTIAGEIVFIGDPFDVGDWDGIDLQVDTLASSGTIAAGDIKWNAETSISSADYPKYDACLADQTLDTTPGMSAVKRIDSNSTTPLRKWLRVYALHTVATAGQSVTLHVSILLKKRVP